MSHKVEVLKVRLLRVGDRLFMKESEYNEANPGRNVDCKGGMIDGGFRLILVPDKTTYRKLVSEVEDMEKRRERKW